MRPELFIGLQISLTGLAVTFLALGLLTLVMRAIMLFLSPGSRFHPPGPPAEGMDEQQREQTAVALAVSIYLLEQGEARPQRDPSLGKLLEE